MGAERVDWAKSDGECGDDDDNSSGDDDGNSSGEEDEEEEEEEYGQNTRSLYEFLVNAPKGSQQEEEEEVEGEEKLEPEVEGAEQMKYVDDGGGDETWVEMRSLGRTRCRAECRTPPPSPGRTNVSKTPPASPCLSWPSRSFASDAAHGLVYLAKSRRRTVRGPPLE